MRHTPDALQPTRMNQFLLKSCQLTEGGSTDIVRRG